VERRLDDRVRVGSSSEFGINGLSRGTLVAAWRTRITPFELLQVWGLLQRGTCSALKHVAPTATPLHVPMADLASCLRRDDLALSTSGFRGLGPRVSTTSGLVA
jgi:hypothetical protein